MGENVNAPKDEYNLVYTVFLLYGIAVLQPWNAVLSGFDFFMETMPTHKPITIYPFAVHFLIVFGMMYVVIRGPKSGSYNFRITLSYVVSAIILLMIPFLAEVGDTAGFWLVLTALVIFGWFAGLGQGAVYALAGGMPFKYIAAIMLGQGISGIFSNVLRTITLCVFPDDTRLSAILFFSVSAAFTLLTALAYCLVLQKNKCF